MAVDTYVLDFFSSLLSVSPEWLRQFWVLLSKAGDIGLIWIAICAGLLIVPRSRKVGMVAALALILSALICELWLKNLIARPRPYVTYPDIQLLLPALNSFSMPSSHTCNSFAAALAIHRYLGKRAVPFIVLAALISISRLALSMHYLTDVLAGAFLGSLCALLAVVLYEGFAALRKRRR